MVGPPPKTRGHQRRSARPRIATIIPAADRSVEVPRPPTGLLPSVAADWATFWSSPLAQAVLPATDGPAVTRLFQLRDASERMTRAIRKEPFVAGYKGQPRVNPLAAFVTATNAEIRQLEDRFGLTPMSRLRLGVTFGEAARSLADLNADVVGAQDDEEQGSLLATLENPTWRPDPTRTWRVRGCLARPRQLSTPFPRGDRATACTSAHCLVCGRFRAKAQGQSLAAGSTALIIFAISSARA